MGKLGTGRNNQLSNNGLLYDSDGNVFDLTQWYKDNSFLNAKSQLDALVDIVSELKIIKQQLAEMTGENIKIEDIEE